MTRPESGKPAATEYGEYYGRYVGKIEGTDIVAVLEDQLRSTLDLIRGLDEKTGDFRYQPGKWSVKEVLGHILDMERVFAYRALVCARNDQTPQAGCEQDDWAPYMNYSNLTLADVAAEFEAVRRSTILLFRHIKPDAWQQKGVASDNPLTTRAAAFMIAGHLEHHLQILKSRYLS